MMASLQQSSGSDSLEKLRSLEAVMIGNYYEPSEGSNPVMSELMFEGIRDFFFEDLEEENESTEIQQFLKHVQLTHNRATFDAFNEILEGMRPSASYPWR